jgi:hypothetical protein
MNQETDSASGCHSALDAAIRTAWVTPALEKFSLRDSLTASVTQHFHDSTNDYS